MDTTAKTPTKTKLEVAKGNPFYGMNASLVLLQQCSKMTDSPSKSAIVQLLTNAWKECSTDFNKRQMFWSVVFSFGDITNREHNIFKKQAIQNVDQGGAGLRKVFLYCLEWIHNNLPDQFYKFLPVFGEYYNLGALTMHHILWTDRFKGTIKEIFKINVNLDRLTDHIASVLNDPKTTENEKKLWARWLWHVPSSSGRKGITIVDAKNIKKVVKTKESAKEGDIILYKRSKQEETLKKDKFVLKCIHKLSEKMGWEIKKCKFNFKYAGYMKFRHKYMLDTEASLFSSGRIRNFSKIQFMEWLDKLPSGERYAVQRKVLTLTEKKELVPKDKWILDSGENVGTLFLEWLNFKDAAQDTLRNLTAEDKKSLGAEEVKKVEKAAKVNVAGTSMIDVVAELLGGKKSLTEANVLAQSILDKIKLEVPVLVVADTSSSMGPNFGRGIRHKDFEFHPNQIAAMMATIFLTKNPNPELQNIFVTFNDVAQVIVSGGDATKAGKNSFMVTSNTKVGSLVDPGKSFVENFNNIGKYMPVTGGTNFACVAEYLKRWVEEGGGIYSEVRKEMINNYPVWLVISDGDMNHMNNAAASMSDFQMKMRQWFGWNGPVVIWDVKQVEDKDNKFKNLENVVYYSGYNAATLNQLFNNIHDLDIIDVFTPLDTMFKSNRYQPVRKLVI